VEPAPRPVRAEDAPALRAFFQALEAERCPFLLEGGLPTTPDSVEDLVQGFLEEPRSALWVVERDAGVVGLAQFAPHAHPQQRHWGHLALAVLAPWRGRGLGRDLMAAFLAWAGGVDGLRHAAVEVFATNAPAIRLYERFGFTRDGVKRAAARVGEDFVDILLLSRRVDTLGK